MLGAIQGRQGHYARKWASGTIAMAYLKIRDEPNLDAGKKKAVEGWIARLAGLVEDSSTGATSRRNNHAYWNGFTNVLNGVILNNKRLFDSGVAAYRLALSEMRTDGALPLELARGKHALHYHNFALTPLVLIAEAAAQQGLDLYRENSGKPAGGRANIHQLVDLVVRSIQDPESFRKHSPTPQTLRKGGISPHIHDRDLTWMEPYYARFKDLRLVPFLRRIRPVYDWRSGGDATLLWGANLPPP